MCRSQTIAVSDVFHDSVGFNEHHCSPWSMRRIII